METRCTKSDVDMLLGEVIWQAENIGIPVSEHISRRVRISGKATSGFGSCTKRKNGTYEIMLSSRVAEAGEGAVRNVLAHEVLHTCPGCSNHGALWKRYAAMMKSAYGYDIRTRADPKELGVRTEYRYSVVCLACGRRYERQKMCRLIRHPSMYRCVCGGRLRRER
ncbi:MAG: SprT-like domain-containing protein [Oscillospiraceae bacterium]|jgi:predicted SprT family Zn-dependent metalloprotease